jgi:hypothetical protein
MTNKNEFYANGFDDAVNGEPYYDGYAPGTAAAENYADGWFAGYGYVMPHDHFEDDNLTDVEADSMTLASAGMGTDEDYGYYGEPDIYDDLGW